VAAIQAEEAAHTHTRNRLDQRKNELPNLEVRGHIYTPATWPEDGGGGPCCDGRPSDGVGGGGERARGWWVALTHWARLQVRFVTAVPGLVLPDTPIAVPLQLRRYGLSEIVNHLAGASGALRPWPCTCAGRCY
jgi:hypothetical protein